MRLKDALKFIISLLLMFFLFIVQVSIFINFKLLNSNFYKETIEKSDYFTLLYEEVDKTFNNLSIMTAIPKDMLLGSVNQDFIKEQTFKNLDNTSQYMKYKSNLLAARVDIQVIEQSINKNLEDYAKEKNIEINNAVKKQLKEVAINTSDRINDYTNLFNLGAVAKFGEFQKFRKICYFLGNYSLLYIISSVILMLILRLLNRRRPWNTFMWVGSSFIPAGLMTLIPATIALVYKLPYRISVATPYIKEGLTKFMLEYAYFLLFIGLLFIALGITLLAMYICLSNREVISNKVDVIQE
ncbi:hypothetical protein CPJCM30710_29150 [Clostridium polyendosporum]|uniref:Uncharacterized protein n=1 Tax=Clostridium polyendosporum TaxID=69208 RepID=A0A919S1Q8_9CLOT|nr:hypothetical protein [Clostridium polyendosporum]GIM30249.1 hypothetical protein CPJCM30710_29150 [Clostridium polyendosporum]